VPPWCWAGCGCCRRRNARLSADVFASCGVFSRNIALLLQSGLFLISKSAKKPLAAPLVSGHRGNNFYLFWPLILMLVTRLAPEHSGCGFSHRHGHWVLCAQPGADRFEPRRNFSICPLPGRGELLAGACIGPASWNQVQSKLAPQAICEASIGPCADCDGRRRFIDTKSAFPGWWGRFCPSPAPRLLSVCARSMVFAAPCWRAGS